MPERFGEPRASAGATPTGRDQHLLTVEVLPVGERDAKAAASPRAHGLDAEPCVDRYARFFGFAKKALDDGRRRVRHRKYAAVGLCLERHAVLFEPAHGVGRLKPVKGAEQFARAARVRGDERTRIEAGIRHIAAPAARDADLRKGRGAAFDDVHIALRVRARTRDRGEESGRAAAGDHDAGDGHARTLARRGDRLRTSCGGPTLAASWHSRSPVVLAPSGESQ
jgi:hypothetical protein